MPGMPIIANSKQWPSCDFLVCVDIVPAVAVFRARNFLAPVRLQGKYRLKLKRTIHSKRR